MGKGSTCRTQNRQAVLDNWPLGEPKCKGSGHTTRAYSKTRRDKNAKEHLAHLLREEGKIP